MKKMKIALLALVMSVFAVSGTFADNVGPGLGRVLLEGKQGKGMEILALTLNGIAGNGLFAITFGTLGYQEGAKIGLAASDAFIAENFDAVAGDIAKGDGEYLDTLSSILKVSDKASFKVAVQNNFNVIYSSPEVTAEEVSAKIKSLI